MHVPHGQTSTLHQTSTQETRNRAKGEKVMTCPLRDLCARYDPEFCSDYGYEGCPLYELVQMIVVELNNILDKFSDTVWGSTIEQLQSIVKQELKVIGGG